MIRKFVFDIDGTLTPSRQKIDDQFAEFFLDFCRSNKVYLVTGSDRKKTEEQLTADILKSASMVFNCSGNEIRRGNEVIHRNFWEPSDDLIYFLSEELENSKFHIKTGTHIEKRTGMVNFSIVGRKCDLLERKEYIHWDTDTHEREIIAERLKKQFPNLDVYIGGETGLDIFEKGYGKSQCVNYIRQSSDDYLYYYGDQIFPGGNDFEIANLCNAHRQVSSWRVTYESLQHLMEVL